MGCPFEKPRIGEALRKIRRSRGMSQRQLGAGACISHAYIGQIERGEVEEPHYLTMARLFAELNTSPDEEASCAPYSPERADRAARNIAHALAVVGAYEAGRRTGHAMCVVEHAAMKRLEGMGG